MLASVAIIWLKRERAENTCVRATPRAAMRKRSGVSRRRRLQTRLCLSVETLLRHRLNLPLPDVQQKLPVGVFLTVRILRLLSRGALDLDCDLDLNLLEEQPDQQSTNRLSAVSPNESDHGGVE